MHFFLPPWLRHGRGREPDAVYSVDIEPYGARLASAGQDCTVNIWSLDVLSRLAIPASSTPAASASAPTSSAPTTCTPAPALAARMSASAAPSTERPPAGALLCALSSHSAAVNCVRWAPTGTLLASGGDDAVVLVYERQHSDAPVSSFGARSDAAPIENWRVRRPLRAHTGDVTDVCWSPDAEKLASASVDNAIYVWNVSNQCVFTKLEGHCGFVKGVAWDPVGRFIASQSDDRSVRIWRTADWKLENHLTQPFESAIYKENSMAFFLRLSWSPCGSQLLATNAHKKPAAHIAPMFSRESAFQEQIEFVGHKEPVVSTRFSPRLYRPHPAKQASKTDLQNGLVPKPHPNGNESALEKPSAQEEQQQQQQHHQQQKLTYTCLALGSKDCGTTIWQAAGIRPFFNMTEMFDSDVIDLSWGTDGYTLVACSTDGRVMYIRFAPEELGDVVPLQETKELLTKLWRQFGGVAANGTPIPESLTQLAMENASKKPIKDAHPSQVPKHANAGVENALAQKKSDPPKPAQFPNGTTTTTTTTTPAAQAASPVVPPVTVSNTGPTPPADPKILAAQNEVRVKGGKRRITPLAVTSVPAPSAALPPTMPRPVAAPAAGAAAESPLKRSRVENAGALSNPFGASAATLAAFPSSQMAAQSTPFPAASFAPASDVKPVAFASPLCEASIVGLNMTLLSGTGEGAGRCRAISTETPPTLLEAREEHSTAGGHMLMCSKGGKVLWRDYHPKSAPITALAGVKDKFAAAASSEGVLFLYSASSGRRLAPPLSLDSAPHLMEAFSMPPNTISGDQDVTMKDINSTSNNEHWFLLVVSRSALCSVFNVKEKRLICARSAAPLLARPTDSLAKAGSRDNLSQARIVRSIALGRVTAYGEPILILSDRHAFVYSRDFGTWVRVADDSMPNSEYARSIAAPSKVGLVRSLQAGIGPSTASRPALSGMSGLQRSAVESLAHLESLMEAAIVLAAPNDYRYYLAGYASRIAAAVADDVENCESRLRELSDTLLNVSNPKEDRRILGMSGRTLLEETVLPIVSANRSLQRFVEEYMENLKLLKEQNAS